MFNNWKILKVFHKKHTWPTNSKRSIKYGPITGLHVCNISDKKPMLLDFSSFPCGRSYLKIIGSCKRVYYITGKHLNLIIAKIAAGKSWYSSDKNMTKTPNKAALSQTTEEYASRSSIHGIGYAFDRELSTFDRVLWLLVVLVFLAVAAALTMNLWTQWRNEQVMRFLFLRFFS